MPSRALIVLAVVLLASCHSEPASEKHVALDDVYSLREQTGPDGCIPGTSTPQEFKYGRWWPGECESANIPAY